MQPVLRVGIDVGAHLHYVGISSPEGVLLEEFNIPHDEKGFEQFFDRVEHHRRGQPVAVAMEGYGGHARPLDQEIIKRGYELFNVNNLKLARFREIFPGPAKTDELDTRLILSLFNLEEHLPLSKGTLAQVHKAPDENEMLKRISRRRRELVEEKVRVANRMQADLRAVCPSLLQITGASGNLWFLRFLASRDDLAKLARMRPESVLGIQGIGKAYAQAIRAWQEKATFSSEVGYVGPMIISDAKRILELQAQIAQLEAGLQELTGKSEIACRLATIPGFTKVSLAELTGEIGTLERFANEASLALYLGMCPLSNQSGGFHGTKTPRQVNWRARAAMMTAVSFHIKQVPESKAYYDKKRAQGKKHNQAVRALGRHLVRVIWRMFQDGRGYEARSEVLS
jgi:transposase